MNIEGSGQSDQKFKTCFSLRILVKDGLFQYLENFAIPKQKGIAQSGRQHFWHPYWVFF